MAATAGVGPGSTTAPGSYQGEDKRGSVDNSVAEAFWSSLKRELVHRYRFATRAEARAAITSWIHRCNAVRLHSSLNYVSPIEWELNYRRQQLQAA